MNLFIIESPFQLICAIEAKEAVDPGNEAILIVKKSNLRKNNDQIKKILVENTFQRVINVPFFMAIFVSDFFLLFVILHWKIKRIVFDNIFIGEIKSTIMRCFTLNFKSKEVYFLDDGIATLAIQEKIMNGISVEEQTEENKYISPIRNFIFQIFRVKYKYVQIPNWFTCFDLVKIKNQKIVKNNFLKSRASLSDNSDYTDSNIVYFIGSSLSEDNRIPMINELSMIKKMSDSYHKYGKSVVYCIHRRESKEKLKLIQEMPNISSIRSSELPLEVDFIANKINISHIATFVSTTLITLPKIYNIEQSDMIILDESLLSPTHVEYYKIIKAKFDLIHSINQLSLN